MKEKMSIFGDGNIKTDIYEDLMYIFRQHYDKEFYDSDPDEKLKFIHELQKVVSAIMEDVL